MSYNGVVSGKELQGWLLTVLLLTCKLSLFDALALSSLSYLVTWQINYHLVSRQKKTLEEICGWLVPSWSYITLVSVTSCPLPSSHIHPNIQELTNLVLPLIQSILARACGVPAVGVRPVDCWQWRSGHYFHSYFLLFFPFFSPPFFSPSRPFLIEGVLGSKNLFCESCLKCPNI